MNDSDSQPAEQTIKIAILIHWMLVFSLFIYGGIAYFIARGSDSSSMDGTEQMIMLVLVLVSLTVIGVGFFFRRQMLDPDTLVGEGDAAASANQYLTGIITQDGLFESIAIYGLVLSILTKQWMIILPFAFTSLLLMLLFRPSRHDFERRLDRGQPVPSDSTEENTSERH